MINVRRLREKKAIKKAIRKAKRAIRRRVLIVGDTPAGMRRLGGALSDLSWRLQKERSLARLEHSLKVNEYLREEFGRWRCCFGHEHEQQADATACEAIWRKKREAIR